METILCAVDLGESTASITRVAASLARVLGARLELLHVLHSPRALPLEYLSNNVAVDIRARAAEALEARAAELEEYGIDIQTNVALGLADDGVLERARTTNADLLVIGTHARQGTARLLLGSVAERVVRLAGCPVVVVPPSHGGRLASTEPLTRPLKIVAGIDRSPPSDAALAWLRAVDQQRRCDLRFVHLYWPPREHERLGIERSESLDADRSVVAVLTRELQGHATAEFGRADVPLYVRPFWGAEADPLAWEAETEGADLLVVGTSRGGHSTALGAIRGAHLPVVCVPTVRPEAAPRRLGPVRTVLVTTDFSPLANAAVPEAYRMLLGSGGEVMLLHVAEPGPRGLDPDRESALEDRLLALVPNGMEAYGIRTGTTVIAGAAPAEAILKAIRRLGPDLVVMSSHGRSGLQRAVRGSVAEEVMRAAGTPVLMVPAGAELPLEAAEDRI